MKPRITVITLGVDDLERAVRFYRDGLGLQTQGVVGAEFPHGAVAFFDLQAGLKLALWPRASIAHDSGIAATPPSSTDLTIGHNVASKEEVDAVMAQAKTAGAAIVKAAHDTSVDDPVSRWPMFCPNTARLARKACGGRSL